MPTRKSSLRTTAAQDAHLLATLLRQAADAVEELPGRSLKKFSPQLLTLRESVLGALAAVEPFPSLATRADDPGEGVTFELDREANAALQLWGGWTAQEFHSQWKQLDRGLVKRTCRVTGLALPRSWSVSQQAELHRRAQRFARNTAL